MSGLADLAETYWMLPIIWVLIALIVGYALYRATNVATLDVDGTPKPGINVKARLSGVVVTFLVVMFVLAGGTLLLYDKYLPQAKLDEKCAVFNRDFGQLVVHEREDLTRKYDALSACCESRSRCESEVNGFEEQMERFSAAVQKAVNHAVDPAGEP